MSMVIDLNSVKMSTRPVAGIGVTSLEMVVIMQGSEFKWKGGAVALSAFNRFVSARSSLFAL